MARRLLPILIVAVACLRSVPAAAGLPPHVYLLARGQSGLWQIDTATGDRGLLELYSYPAVLAVRQAGVTTDGEVLFTAINALQQTGIHAYNPGTGSRAGVSGPVLDGGDASRGNGPSLEPGTSGLVVSPSGLLFALREFSGLMSVSTATGDRIVVSQSVAPQVGAGFMLTRPIDLACETSGSLLIMDEFEGLVRVRLTDGARTMEYPSTLFIEPPTHFDVLPDGRVVHCLRLRPSHAPGCRAFGTRHRIGSATWRGRRSRGRPGRHGARLRHCGSRRDRGRPRARRPNADQRRRRGAGLR
jgi:hypothetical protein